jgi:antitoxin Phd
MENPRGSVLMVDDDASILKDYSRSLTEAGFQVAKVSKAPEALRRAQSHHFDVVFSDFFLPEMDGLTLLRRMRAKSPDLEVIMMLDTSDNRLLVEAAEAGAVQALVKPIEPRLLAEIADFSVRRSRARQNPVEMFRQDRGYAAGVSSITATEAKNEFGRMLEKLNQGHVFITKHDTAKAVLMSIDEFTALSRSTEVSLNTLTSEFDALLDRMQTPRAKTAMKAAFRASPKQMGKAALAAARARG